MSSATRASEGFPYRCKVRGKGVLVATAEPLGDVVCPHCGIPCVPKICVSTNPSDDIHKLSETSIFVETDDEGEIVRMYMRGDQYNDRTLARISRFVQVPWINVTFTSASKQGVARLRELMPHNIIVSDLFT